MGVVRFAAAAFADNLGMTDAHALLAVSSMEGVRFAAASFADNLGMTDAHARLASGASNGDNGVPAAAFAVSVVAAGLLESLHSDPARPADSILTLEPNSTTSQELTYQLRVTHSS